MKTYLIILVVTTALCGCAHYQTPWDKDPLRGPDLDGRMGSEPRPVRYPDRLDPTLPEVEPSEFDPPIILRKNGKPVETDDGEPSDLEPRPRPFQKGSGLA